MIFASLPITMGTGGHWSFIHPVAKWVLGIWAKMASQLFTPNMLIIVVGMLPSQWRWYRNVQILAKG